MAVTAAAKWVLLFLAHSQGGGGSGSGTLSEEEPPRSPKVQEAAFWSAGILASQNQKAASPQAEILLGGQLAALKLLLTGQRTQPDPLFLE